MERGSGGFVGTVKGIEVRVDDLLLSRLLRLPREGPSPSVHSDRAMALNLILGRDDVGPLEVISANQLSAEMRLLHNIVGRILFPKTGRFDFISERDLVVMHCVIEEIPLNLPRMMMNYMGEASTKVLASLPYGMVLTLVFREFGVPILEGEPSRQLRHTDIYTAQSLHRMGYRKVDGHWEKRAAGQSHQEEGVPAMDRGETGHESPLHPAPSDLPSSSGHVPDPFPAPAPPSVPSSVRLDDDQMRMMVRMIADEMSARQQAEFTRLSEQISTELTGLAERVSHMEHLHSQHLQMIMDELRTVSERLSTIETSNFPDVSQFAREAASLRGRIELTAQQIESLFGDLITTQDGRMVSILSSLERLVIRMDQQAGRSAHQQPSEPGPSSSQPARPSQTGPTRVYTRSHTRDPSSSRPTRVHSRSGSPVHIPSDQD